MIQLYCVLKEDTLENKFNIQDLISGVRNREPEKEEAFFLYANKIIWNEANRFLNKLQSDLLRENVKSIGQEFLPEDVCNDIFLMILQQIKKKPYIEIRHPAAYIRKVTKNYCRRLRSHKKSLVFQDHIRRYADSDEAVDIIEDHTVDMPYNIQESKQETKEEKIQRYYYESFPLNIREGIERVILHLASFYEIKMRLSELIIRDEKPFLIYKKFLRLEKDIKKIMRGHIPSEEEIQRQFYLQNVVSVVGTPELDKKTDEQLAELHAFPKKYGFYFSQVYLHLYKIKMYLENEMRLNDPDFSYGWIPDPKESDLRKIEFWSNFIPYMPKMKADPANLLFLILEKVDAIKRGTYRNHKKINLIFTYQRLKTAGTAKAFLFDSINPGIRRSTIATKRKAAYKKRLKAKHYQDLINFIYKKSFIEYL